MPARSDDLETRAAGGLTWLVRPRLVTGVVETFLADPEAPFSSRTMLIRAGERTAVARAESVVIKRYSRSNFQALKDWFRPSKARKAFSNARRLELAGVSSPNGIATADRWLGPFSCVSYFIMEAINNAVPLSKWRGNEVHPIESVARLVGSMHRQGFIHSDLNHGNVLYDDAGQAHLIDLDGLAFVGEVPAARQQKELERLVDAWRWSPKFGEAERAEFLRLYRLFRAQPPSPVPPENQTYRD